MIIIVILIRNFLNLTCAIYILAPEETKRTIRTIRNIYEKYSKQQLTVEGVRSIVEEYDNCMEMLLYICAHGCYWGTKENVGIWIKSVELISECVVNNGYQMWTNLSKYPIYLMTYIIGISSLASGNLYNFIHLIKEAKIIMNITSIILSIYMN